MKRPKYEEFIRSCCYAATKASVRRERYEVFQLQFEPKWLKVFEPLVMRFKISLANRVVGETLKQSVEFFDFSDCVKAYSMIPMEVITTLKDAKKYAQKLKEHLKDLEVEVTEHYSFQKDWNDELEAEKKKREVEEELGTSGKSEQQKAKKV